MQPHAELRKAPPKESAQQLNGSLEKRLQSKGRSTRTRARRSGTIQPLHWRWLRQRLVLPIRIAEGADDGVAASPKLRGNGEVNPGKSLDLLRAVLPVCELHGQGQATVADANAASKRAEKSTRLLSAPRRPRALLPRGFPARRRTTRGRCRGLRRRSFASPKSGRPSRSPSVSCRCQ